MLPLQGARVQFLVREIRSHKSHGLKIKKKKTSVIYKSKTLHTATLVIWGRMGCAGEGPILAHMKVISPTDEVTVKHWGILGLASYGRSGNGDCVDEQMVGQKNDICRHACMHGYIYAQTEKEQGAGKESGRDTELRYS